MITVDIKYVDDDIWKIVDWLEANVSSSLTHSRRGTKKFDVITGKGWQIYHTTIMIKEDDYPNPLPYLITRAKFDNEEDATLFMLRWR